MPTNSIAMLQLWRLISPALPVGAYAYSQGLEYAIECEWVTDEKSCFDWISGVLINNIAYLDISILLRFYKAWELDDQKEIKYWSAYLLASRETNEMLLEDQQIGDSLARLLTDIGLEKANVWQQHSKCSYPLMFALAGQHWKIPIEDLALGYAWAWCENQVAAAMKVIPLGQTQGQTLLQSLMPIMKNSVTIGLEIEDDEIGRTCPGQVMASALHEQQYSRLFRS